MKILLLVPFKHDENNEKNLRSTIPMDIDIKGLSFGDPSDCRYDEALHIVETCDAIVQAEQDGYDAVVIACQGDPGVDEARELVKIPVVAVTKTLLHIAATLGDKLCIITPNSYVERRTRQNAIRYGFRDFVATRTIEVSARDGIDAYSVYKETGEYTPLIEQFVQECIKAIEEDKAEILSTGCGAIMWMSGIAQAELEKRGYQIPFINPTLAACEFAKALVNIGVVNPNYPEPIRKTGRSGCCI